MKGTMERIGDTKAFKDRNLYLRGADIATQRGWTGVPNFILESKEISAGAKLTYAMLLKYARELDQCFPGQGRLAQDMGNSERSVRTWLKELERVGLISIGSEDAKGNEIVKKARELIKADPNLNFVGNIEGRDIFRGACDVAVCDGFVGNVILKLTEGLVEGLFKAIKHELMQEKLTLALKFKPVMLRIYQKYDYNVYGGAPLLGINGTAVICHGSSKRNTIKNAILASKKFYSEKINEKIAEYLLQTSVRTDDEQEQGS